MTEHEATEHADGCCCDECNEGWHPLSCECCGGYAKNEGEK